MRTLAAVAAVLVIVFGAISVAHAQFPLPQQPTQPAQPTPAGDTRGARVKSALEAKGLTVHGTGVVRGPGFYRGESEVDVFWADVTATYAQPTSEKVDHQALLMWDAMYSVLSSEAPVSILSALQVWTKYGLIAQTRIRDITTVLAAWQAAKTEDDKKQAWKIFLETVRIRVYDLEKRQFVDEKDFISKNFTR